MLISTKRRAELSILLCIRHFFPIVGGAETQALHLARELKRQGLNVEIVTGRYGGAPRFETVDDVNVRRLFVGVYLPVVHELFFLASLAVYLIRARNTYDVIQLFQLQLSTLVAVIVGKQLLGKPVVTRSSNTKGSGVLAVWRAIPGHVHLLAFVFRHVNAVVALSTEMVRELREAGCFSASIRLIPNGVPPFASAGNGDRVRERLGIRPERLILISVGRLTVPKRHAVLIDALATMAKAPDPVDVCLVLLGDGEEKEELELQAQRAGVENLVFMPGVVSNVDDYLDAADIFVLPSSYEGLSNALLEAMNAGLPVVASRASGTVDLIQHGQNGLLFDADDRCMLVAHLRALANQPELRQQLGANAARTIREGYTIDKSTVRYIALYRELLDAKATGQ